MRCLILVALGIGQAAMAVRFSNTTMTDDGKEGDKSLVTVMPPPTPTPTPPPVSSSVPPPQDGLPIRVGDFKLFGCANSKDGFPNFLKVASSKHMSLDFCAASCPSRYFGVHNTDCYCGDKIDQLSTSKVAQAMCDKPCPGKSSARCGGLGSGQPGMNAVAVRMAPQILLSMYERIQGAEGQDDTITVTVTKTTTGTVTTCDSGAKDCVLGAVTTAQLAVTTQICPIEWHFKKIVCYGILCALEIPCGKCPKYKIICEGNDCRPEVCGNEDCTKLVICTGGICKIPTGTGDEGKKKIVCFDGKCAVEKCFGDECQKKLVCVDDQCQHEKCSGDECGKKIICGDKDCKPEPDCNGGGGGGGGGNEGGGKGGEEGGGGGGNEGGGGGGGIVCIIPGGGGDEQQANQSIIAVVTGSPVTGGSSRTTLAFHLLGIAAGLLFML